MIAFRMEKEDVIEVGQRGGFSRTGKVVFLHLDGGYMSDGFTIIL